MKDTPLIHIKDFFSQWGITEYDNQEYAESLILYLDEHGYKIAVKETE